ncbi:MAG: hypothetical protein KC502_04440 [Myxococcales bacterium]|nr:hypothetical protein [Myxococcales bacterium]
MKQRRSRFRGALSVDTGGWLVASPRFHGDKKPKLQLRAETFFKSFAAMGYHALNIGEHELALPPAQLKKLAKRYKLQLVSSNIIDKKTRNPAFQPAVLKTIGGIKFGIFGLVTSAPQARGDNFAAYGLEVNDPARAARAAVTVLRKNGAQVIVCLSAMRRQEADLVTDKVKGIDIVLGTTGMELTMQLATMGRSFFADTYTKGKYIGEVLWTPGAEKSKWAAANLKATLQQQSQSLQMRVTDLSQQLTTAGKPNSPVQLTAQSRKLMQRELVRMRAKLQRVKLELDGDLKAPAGAGQVRLSMHPLNTDVEDDKRVLKIVERFKKKYPSKPGH